MDNYRFISRFVFSRQVSRSFDLGELSKTSQKENESECRVKSKCRVGAIAGRSSLRRRLLRAKSLGHVGLGQVHGGGGMLGQEAKSEVGEASVVSYDVNRVVVYLAVKRRRHLRK